jgi:predicted lipid-binding transport protein (Tim44 family)
MPEEFPYADLVIMALIAGFILLRLRSILGQKTDDDKPNFFQPSKPKASEDSEPIIQLSEKSIKLRPRVEMDPYSATLSEGIVLQSINDIKAKDPLFNATTFLEGAKMAFEMVFDAFAKGDKQTLSILLSQEIYNDFIRHIDEREKQENKQETTLLSVKAKEISGAKFDKNMAQITVHFESEQVTIERGKTGEIVSGDPSDTHHVNDEWVFERDVTSKNPNWKIIET